MTSCLRRVVWALNVSLCALSLTACSGGGSSNSSDSSGTTHPMVPTVASISPATLAAGSGITTLSVTGTNFTSSSVVSVGGVAEPTIYLSPTQLTAQVPASQLISGANLLVAVANGSTSSSGGTAVNLVVNNPVPAITSFSPSTFSAGAAATPLTITGSGFVPTTVIQVNGMARTTTFVSGTQLTISLTAADLAAGGTLSLQAINSTPGGGNSSASSVSVNYPLPTIATIAPTSSLAGTTTPTTISVTGTNFTSATTVMVDSTAHAATVTSANQLSFQLSVADQAAAAKLSITTLNPAPGGGFSNAATFAVNPPTPTPTLTAVNPTSFIAGSAASPVVLRGTNFNSKCTAQWNSTTLTALTVTATAMSFSVPASLLASSGSATVTVSCSTALNPVSNAMTVTITDPPAPTLTSLSLTAAPIGTAVKEVLTGTGFTTATAVTLNGVALPTTYTSTNSLTATLPAASLATPGNYALAITTPAPGGGTSAPLYLTAYVAVPNNSMVYNPSNGLFYLSVPSVAGAPYGNTIVSVDPLTGKLGTPIPVGSEPNRLAITSDGRYLWVALDGASAVQKVDLTTGTALYQFSIDAPGDSTYTVAALAALPGSPDSVVVSTYYGGYTTPTGRKLAIFDGGVARPNAISFSTYAPFPWALIVDGTTNEIYGPGTVQGIFGTYITYTYNSNGIAVKSSTSSNLWIAQNNTDDVQIVGPTLYNSYGQALNSETGALLGTFYSSGTTAAQGSVAIDSTLGKAFILDGASSQFATSNTSSIGSATLRAFNTADYSSTAATSVPVALPLFRASYQYAGPTGQRLTRWGSNGLAFRNTGGFVSLRSSLVKDLSAVNADIAVVVTAPTTASTGSNASYTVTATNNGPSSASGVSLVSAIPSNGLALTATASAGSCVVGATTVCNLGTVTSGASIQVTINVQLVNPGTATVTTQVNAAENDPALANNSASASVSVSGAAYNGIPALTALSPAGIVTGSSDTQITLTGTGFTAGSSVLLNGAVIQTSFDSPTQLTATVPGASLASVGWAALSVTTPAPGGGVSGVVPLYVFSAIPLTANHILYDPYSRKLLATIGTGTATLASNSLLMITPDTGSLGMPVPLAGTPTSLAESTDGQFLYTLLPDASQAQIARFNMLTRQMDFTASGFQTTGYNVGLRDLATIPGSPNALAVDEGEYPGTSIFDFDVTQRTANRRGAATGIYTGTCLTSPDPSRLFVNDLYSSGSLLKSYSISAAGLVNGAYPYYTGAVLQNMNCMKADGNFLFGQAGGVASLSGSVPSQTGIFEGMPNVSNYGAGIKDFAPDASLGRSFFLTSTSPNNYSAIFDSVTAFDNNTFMPSGGGVSLPFSTVEGTAGFTGVDVVRWGQDGLAILTSSGRLYLLRGPIVVPGLLNAASAPSLSTTSPVLVHGEPNVQLTITGSNFLPGAATFWNGSYRTTTVNSSTELTVAIPSSDLAVGGTVVLTVNNPGSPASVPLSIQVQ